MPTFVYKALNLQGQEVTDSVEATNRKTVIERLTAESLTPVSITSQEKDAGRVGHLSLRVTKTDVETFTRELANLLAAGVPLSRALSILSREASREGAKKQWKAIHDLVSEGTSLADAMAQFPKTFPSVNVAMVRAGETGGFLDLVLKQIADFRNREQELLGKVRSALVYPVILAVMATGILIFLLTYFIPKFSAMFVEFGGALPALTEAIVGLSDFVIKYWLVLVIVVVGTFVWVRRAISQEQGRKRMERICLKTPMFGTAIGRFALVRFCRMLGTLVQSGVPLVTGLRTAKEAIGNEVLAETVTEAIEKVQRGQSLARSLGECPELFPASVVEMISVAEESGRLDDELVRLANAYEQQLDRHLKMMVTMAEPAMLFVMAVLVGTVVIGMLLPIFNLQELIR
ncbi:MAG: type II secretion system F family protein [Planctomycetes bacterium]|nr:type II secretion system F family protein [Planctomycetota bacterium]